MEACALPKKNTLTPPAGATHHTLCDAVLPVWVEQLRLDQTGSEKAVFDMMKAFSALVESGQHDAQSAPLPVSADLLDQMYRGFQYQDSLSQILAILIRDMERMQQTLGNKAEDGSPTAPAAWLERLQSEFVMQAQRTASLSGSPTPSGMGAASDQGNASQGADDLTFF